MTISYKHFLKYLLFIILFILYGCKFQEPMKGHGIIFLENRAKQLIVNKSNKNDTVKLLGKPHIRSLDDINTWIFVERILTRGEYHKLGQNILKENNVLILNFNKYGILEEKKFLDKNEIKKISFSKDETENDITRKSFIQKTLQSIKQKMYGNR